MNKCNCQSNPCSPPPSIITLLTTEGLARYTNCIVRVVSTNSTYFVNSCKEITIISSGPVFQSDYDPKTNKLGLADQVCYDFANNIAYAFNAAGEYRTFALEEAA